LNQYLQRYRDFFLVSGILLLILGMRIFIGIRFVAEIPQEDDLRTVEWLQKWAQGIHEWVFIITRHYGHPMEMYYLANLGQFLLNGYWDGRLDFLVYAFVHTAYAAVVIATFGNVLTPRDRGWILALIFLLFAVPFAGYRIAWGLLWPHSAMMTFALGAIYQVVYHGQSWRGVVFAIFLAACGSVNVGAGCLGAFMVVSLAFFQAVMARRITSKDVVLCGACLVIFFIQFLGNPGAGRIGFLEGLNALLKSLAWPVVFIPGIGWVTLVPLIGLLVAQFLYPSFRQKHVTYVLAVGGLLFLMALATGAYRGENNNMGMPSGRYADIFIMVPLFSAVALGMLYRGSVGRQRSGWGLFICFWGGLQVFGFSLFILYRVIPFVAGDSGEWNEGQKQSLFHDLSRGAQDPYSAWDPIQTSVKLTDELVDTAQGRLQAEAMTLPMMAGFPILDGSQGNYLPNGYHPSYRPRPGLAYVGSFDPHTLPAPDEQSHFQDADKWFISGTFKPQAPYLTIDLLVDKKARLTNYRLDGITLTLVDTTSGQREELLPKLSHTFPFALRDWELIYARVTPGHDYQLESRTAQPGVEQWIAFSEPLESGYLTPLIIGLSQSGKLFCLCGMGLLFLVLVLDRMRQESGKFT
jgi:hypothetical protein